MMAEGTDIRASVRNVSISPQKVRRVIDLVRGKDANHALELLKFTPNSAAKPVFKVIRSAVANAENSLGLTRDELYIHRISADQGPTRRWRRFGARGRFKPILRRSCHISVVLRESDPNTE